MSTQYTTEPPPTATVLLHTTAGPLTISLFASQTPLTCRNFIQLCLDGYYDNTIFHRVAPGFVIQTGDPTGTGEGGQNIYEDREFEKLDADWAKLLRTDEGEPVRFGDELHSRLKFNRRGLVGLAKGTGANGNYGSQFFITLGDCRAELDGKCTMFGRVEGEGIYNVVKVSEGELIDGTERPMYPEKILKTEVIDRPNTDPWQKILKRIRVAARTHEPKDAVKMKPAKKKGGKALLSFGGEEEGEEGLPLVKPKKAKFNTALIESSNGDSIDHSGKRSQPALKPPTTGSVKKAKEVSPPPQPQKRKAALESKRSPSPKRRKPSFHDSTTQLPLRNPESPSRSNSSRSSAEPTGSHSRSRSDQKTNASSLTLAAEIAALKASMRRDTTATTTTTTKKKSALESLIPSTSTRGRRRPKAGDTNTKDDARSMNLLDAFRARLEGAAGAKSIKAKSKTNGERISSQTTDHSQGERLKHNAEREKDADDYGDEDEEARLCDLHFISNCQSCFSQIETTNKASQDGNNKKNNPSQTITALDIEDENDRDFLSHSLTFEKDRLGKDLTWKKKNEEELVVIDPREKEKTLGIDRGGKKGGHGGKHNRLNKSKR